MVRIHFDGEETSETYAEQVTRCPGSGSRAVVWRATMGYTWGDKRPGSREAERALEDSGADPLNLIRVMPAKGAMRNSISKEPALREEIPGCPSRLPLGSRIATEGGCA